MTVSSREDRLNHGHSIIHGIVHGHHHVSIQRSGSCTRTFFIPGKTSYVTSNQSTVLVATPFSIGMHKF